MHHPAVSFYAPYRVYVPERWFTVNIPPLSAALFAAAVPPGLTPGGIRLGDGNVEVAHDIFGFGGRMRYTVILGETLDTQDPEWKQFIMVRESEFVTTALQVVNRFLAVYRDKDKDNLGQHSFHVIELVPQDLMDVQIIVTDEMANRFSDYASHWVGPQSVMSFNGATVRPEHITSAIQSTLATNSQIPLDRELLMSALNHIWRRQLRIAVIEANAAFESFVSSALDSAFPSVSLNERTELFSKICLLDVELSKEAAAKSQPYTKWSDQGMQGWKALTSKDLLEWHSRCYELRNRVIHRGYNEVTDVEATSAVKSSIAAINFITSQVLQLRK